MPTLDPASIKYASIAADRTPVAALAAALQQPRAALVVLFVGQLIDREALAAELAAAFPKTPLIACTTAGEIGPAGYAANTITGVSFPAEHFKVEIASFDRLQEIAFADWSDKARQALRRLEAQSEGELPANVFGFVLIDGLSRREEPFVRNLYAALGRIPLIGGSAGDGLRFERTYVYADGQFRSDAAVLALIATPLPVKIFKTQHFERAGERMVVTEADAATRTVREINGLPAATEYARAVGVEAAQLTPQIFAAHPVVVHVGNTDYVRSIQKVNDDGSLSFFCAIDEGIVLTVARGVDLIENLATSFAEVAREIGTPQLILGCDCILRYLEANEKTLVSDLSALLARHRVVGFSSYGEQYCGMHVNQTFTGVAIGAAPA